jgi:hypothetical protein
VDPRSAGSTGKAANAAIGLATVALVAVLAHGSWTFASQALAELRSPWSADYGEGCTLAMAALLAGHGSYFPALVDYPFLVANYPPVFVSIVALGHRLLGPSLLFPRAVALGATLALVLLVFVVLRRLLGSGSLAAAFALLFGMPWFVTTWSALARVDTLALAFTLAGLAIVLRHGPDAPPWPALACFWLAFFTKQSMVAAPLAVLVELALSRDRRFARAAAAYVLPLAALFALLALATRGRSFEHLLVYTAAASYEWDRMAESYVQFAVIAGPLLLLIGAGLGATWRGERSGRILLLYFGLSLAGLATIAKEGAAQNYFLEPWLATLLAAAAALRALGERAPRLQLFWPVALALAAAVSHYSYPSLDRLPHALSHPERASEWPALRRLIRETPGPVLSENLSLLVLDNRPVLLEPFGIKLLAEHGLVRTDRLVRDCEAGRFPLVVVEHRTWDVPGLGACLEARYEPVAELGGYEALRPRAGAEGERLAPANSSGSR